MPKANIREIELPDGKTVKAIQAEFEVIKEDWNIYKLSDGTQVRVKNVVSRTFLIVDEDGNPIPDSSGLPQVVVQGSINVSTSIIPED